MAWTTPTVRTTGDLMTAAIWNQDVVANPIALTPAGFTATFDGGGGPIATNARLDLEIPFKCDITQVTCLADTVGSIIFDLYKGTYGGYAPGTANTITASAKPTIAGTTKAQDATLTGWTKSLAAGDIIRINVDSCSTITRCSLNVRLTRS